MNNTKNQSPVVSLHSAALSFGQRNVWKNVNVDILPGEFVVVLGPNGSGKTSLLKCLLGLQSLSHGSRQVAPDFGPENIGYIPQHHGWNDSVSLRGRDLVSLGINGHLYGWRRANNQVINDALRQVDALEYADMPLDALSGGQRQRLRVAAALAAKPTVLFCDEPFLSLDLAGQQAIAEGINQLRTQSDAAVVLVTHDINPVLPFADKVVYVVGGRVLVGKPQEVLTSKALSDLYGVPIEVQRIHDKLVVYGAGDSLHAEAVGGHHG